MEALQQLLARIQSQLTTLNRSQQMVIGLCAVICGLILVALGFRYLLIPVMVG